LKKVTVKCPICKEPSQDEGCTLAALEKVVEDKVHIYCCASLEKRVKR